MRITEKFRENARELGKHRPITIGFLGDSVTQGCFELYNTSEQSLETEFRSYHAYHNKLKRIFNEIFPSVPVNVINAGISGDTASGGLNRLDRDILSFLPDLVVICYGLNDANRGLEGLAIYAESLEAMFQRLNSLQIETIFMTPNTIATRVVAEEKDPYIRSVMNKVINVQTQGIMDAYMAKAREVCEQHHIPVCDCYSKWKKLEDDGSDITRLLANRINHPSEKMHWLFAVSLFEMIMDL